MGAPLVCVMSGLVPASDTLGGATEGHDSRGRKPPKIFSGGGMRPLIVDLVPLFERAHDAIVDVEFRLTSALKQAVETGAIFDLVIMPRHYAPARS